MNRLNVTYLTYFVYFFLNVYDRACGQKKIENISTLVFRPQSIKNFLSIFRCGLIVRLRNPHADKINTFFVRQTVRRKSMNWALEDNLKKTFSFFQPLLELSDICYLYICTGGRGVNIVLQVTKYLFFFGLYPL